MYYGHEKDISHVTFSVDQIGVQNAKHLRRPSAYFTIFQCLREGRDGPMPHSQICLGLCLSVLATKFTHHVAESVHWETVSMHCRNQKPRSHVTSKHQQQQPQRH